jgi:hypothetical protein
LTVHTTPPSGDTRGTQYFEADYDPADQAAGKQVIPYRATLPFKSFDVSSAAGTRRRRSHDRR